MREIFKRRAFWIIFILILLAIFIYPPFLIELKYVFNIGKEFTLASEIQWNWFFHFDYRDKIDIMKNKFPVKVHKELYFEIIFVESTIAFLLTTLIFLFFGRKNKKG